MDILLMLVFVFIFFLPIGMGLTALVYIGLRKAPSRVRRCATSAVMGAFIPVPVPAAHNMLLLPVGLGFRADLAVYIPLYLGCVGVAYWAVGLYESKGHR